MSNRQHPIKDAENHARDAVAQAWALLDEHDRKKAIPLLRKAIRILEDAKLADGRNPQPVVQAG